MENPETLANDAWYQTPEFIIPASILGFLAVVASIAYLQGKRDSISYDREMQEGTQNVVNLIGSRARARSKSDLYF